MLSHVLPRLTHRQTVKRALRALQTPAYEAARKKNPALPEVTDRASLENTFKLLPMSMLALRVSKMDPHEGHDHGPVKKGKRVKGLWTVRIEQQQDAEDDMYYAWLWEGPQLMRKVYAGLALLIIFTLVCYPLWPLKMRQGVYYLSWAFLCFLGLFFAMAIFRVILFCITYFVLSPGFWLFPNLWEDVSVIDSFKPVWAWHDVSVFFPRLLHSMGADISDDSPTPRRRRSPSRAALPMPRRLSPRRLDSPRCQTRQQRPLLHKFPPGPSSAKVTYHPEWRSSKTMSDLRAFFSMANAVVVMGAFWRVAVWQFSQSICHESYRQGAQLSSIPLLGRWFLRT